MNYSNSCKKQKKGAISFAPFFLFARPTSVSL